MRPRELTRREMGIVFGARVTWFVLAASALLIGHGFVLAIDLYSAASRSASNFALMQRELDPLAGVIRPTLGGLQLSTALLLPILAARGLAIERERGSYGPLALAAGSTSKVVAAKAAAALLGSACMLLPVLVLLAWFRMLGGHVDLIETTVALAGHGLHLLTITAVALAAAAATRTVAQATVATLVISLGSWAIDVGDGFAALAWLGHMEWASLTKQLEAFEHGVISLASLTWFVSLATVAVALAFTLGRIEVDMRRRLSVATLLGVGIAALLLAPHMQRGYDWSEQRRASLPPATVAALREIAEPITIEVLLDRDDGRRTQLERDALAKLRLARPDIEVLTPLDEREELAMVEHDRDYGLILVRVGASERSTRSIGKRELSTLLFEAAGTVVPDWQPPPYAGHPTVIEGRLRMLTVILAYGVVPGGFLVLGWFMTRRRARR